MRRWSGMAVAVVVLWGSASVVNGQPSQQAPNTAPVDAPPAVSVWRSALTATTPAAMSASTWRREWAAAGERATILRSEPRVSPHHFVDTLNVTLTAVEAAALVADGIYTQRGLQRYPELVREVDPLARPFVDRGWPGQLVGGAIVVSADVGLRYLFHRTNHHRLERWFPMILTVYGSAGAIHNARLLRELERQR